MIGIGDMVAAPGRWWRLRRAGRRWRRQCLPLPEPGSEAAEWLAYFERLRQPATRPRPARRMRRRPA